jgi:hypothetical protein
MRRLVVSAAAKPAPAPSWWGQSLAVAALLALMVGAGLLAGRQAAEREDLMPPIALEDPPPDGGERRQLQFSTPGGTRIIWVFDPGFDLKETMP